MVQKGCGCDEEAQNNIEGTGGWQRGMRAGGWQVRMGSAEVARGGCRGRKTGRRTGCVMGREQRLNSDSSLRRWWHC